MPWIRSIWFRLLLATIAMIGIDLLVLSSHDIYSYRRSFLDALIATSLIFAITSGLIMAIINNYVRGVREQFIEQSRRIRQLAWVCYDQFTGEDNHEFRDVLKSHVRPLVEKSLPQWLQVENFEHWGEGIEEQLNKLLKTDNPSPKLHTLVYRYLLPLEEEINRLVLLYIRRVAAKLHAQTAKGVCYLLCFAVAVIAAGKIMPSTPLIDLAVLNSAAAIVTYAVLELLFVLSYLLQEVSEEYIDITDKLHEEEIQNDGVNRK